MNQQTEYLLQSPLPHTVTPPHVLDLLAAYSSMNPISNLDMVNLYAEPYYGDFNKCSVVLLTHNPGEGNITNVGIESPYANALLAPPLTISENYFNIASVPAFPNSRTNNWVNRVNGDLKEHFRGFQAFENKAFIRDLVPYHANTFVGINMPLCKNYLYQYFFNQVIEASFKSELYQKINTKSKNPKRATIIYARGNAWKDEFGLGSIGWNLIGKIYSNYYIYKANFDIINKFEEFKIEQYPESTLDHDVYIVVLTQVMQGGILGVYKKKVSPDPVSLTDIVNNYKSIYNKKNPYYIEHSEGLDHFIGKLL